MSHRTSAVVVTDSITEYGEATRLTSMLVVFPKMVLGERNRHRGFSLSDRSSRAVPPEKLIQEVMDDPAVPALFRARTKGMGGGDVLKGDALDDARRAWRYAAYKAVYGAENLLSLGLAKEIVNRPLDSFIRMKSLKTATRDVWMNFFGLRLDAAADPTIRVLAERCWEAYCVSIPRVLEPGQWHLPFVSDDDLDIITPDDTGPSFDPNHPALKLSAARCAHLSYESTVDGAPLGIEQALSIYDKLVGSRPMHLSPLEHQATPDVWRDYLGLDEQVAHGRLGEWACPHEHGNLRGWRQHRKMLPGEAVAPLPEGYA